MSKDEEIRFVGQPILKQILKLIDAVNIKGLINNVLNRKISALKSHM
jgi:hypothetical protein